MHTIFFPIIFFLKKVREQDDRKIETFLENRKKSLSQKIVLRWLVLHEIFNLDRCNFLSSHVGKCIRYPNAAISIPILTFFRPRMIPKHFNPGLARL